MRGIEVERYERGKASEFHQGYRLEEMRLRRVYARTEAAQIREGRGT